jgi:formylglycine-generating enzyme required for sulfatase activity
MIFRILLALGILAGIIAFFTPAFVIFEDGVATPASALDIRVAEQTFRVRSLLAGKVGGAYPGLMLENDDAYNQCLDKYHAQKSTSPLGSTRDAIEQARKSLTEQAECSPTSDFFRWWQSWFGILVLLGLTLGAGARVTRVGGGVVLAGAGLITLLWLAQPDLDATKTLTRLQAALATLGIIAGLGLRAPLGLRARAEETEDTREGRATAIVRMWDSRLSAGGWALGALILLPFALSAWLGVIRELIESLLAPDWSLVMEVPVSVLLSYGLAWLTKKAISETYSYLRKIKGWWGIDPFAPSSQRAEGADPFERSSQQAWMSKFGEDEHGRWAEAEVAGVTFRFRYCPAGTFQMGSPASEEGRSNDEGPQHEVQLTKGFWLGATPVTQRQWEAVTGENPSEFKGPDRPVEQVSWEDCAAFLGKVNARCPGLDLRLPTEAEWEYACRAGTTGPTYLGSNDAATLDGLGWYDGNSGDETHPVGQKAPNAWGLYDTLGNVREWCADWKADYPSGRQVDPKGPGSGTGRVIRGGRWYLGASSLRAAYRNRSSPGNCDSDIGFRVARSGP